MLGFKTKVIFGTVCQRIFLGQCAREYFWDSVPEITFRTVQLEEEHGVLNFLFSLLLYCRLLRSIKTIFLGICQLFLCVLLQYK